jgi:hypothetical protein
LYQSWGKPERAAEWKRKLSPIESEKEERQGENK